MKNFTVSIVFVSTVVFGLAITNSSGFWRDFEDSLHHSCVRWADETFNKPLFTLNEAKLLLGKKVFSRSENFKRGESGRVVHLEPVGQDKFLVAVYWDRDSREAGLTFHDKEWFSRDFEVTD